MVGPSECAGPARPVPFACQCRWLRLCREPEPMGTHWQGAWYPGYPQVPGEPNGSQRTVNGPLTDPLTGNGRIRPLTVNGVRELSKFGSALVHTLPRPTCR